MGVIVLILLVEEETAATLRVQIPKQYTKTALGQKAGQVNRSCGFSNASLNIINRDFFQNLKLITKLQSA